MVFVCRHRPRPRTGGAIEGRFCVMTVPMQELAIVNPVRPVARAGRAMVHLDDLHHGQDEQTNPGAAPTVGFQQAVAPSWDFGMCLSRLAQYSRFPS